MNTGISKSLDSGAWRKLYTAVLFEVDKTKLPERIARAEKALALRARELFYAAGDNIEEGEALHDAMCALHALQPVVRSKQRAGINAGDHLELLVPYGPASFFSTPLGGSAR